MNFGNRKRKIWENENSAFYRWKIKAKDRFRNMTMIQKLMIFMTINMIAMTSMIFLFQAYVNESNYNAPTPYGKSLVVACKNSFFYSINFSQCESVNTRPQNLTNAMNELFGAVKSGN